MSVSYPGKDGQFFIDPVNALFFCPFCFLSRDHQRRNRPHLRIQTDISDFFPASPGIKGSESILVNIDPGTRIDFCKRKKTSSVIVVAVTENDRVHLSQIDPEFFRIAQEKIRLSRIHKDFMAVRFNVEAEAVLCLAVAFAFCVFC